MRLGYHITYDLYGVEDWILYDWSEVANKILENCGEVDPELVSRRFGSGSSGSSGALFTKTGRLSWYTWPDRGFVALDYVSCVEPNKIHTKSNRRFTEAELRHHQEVWSRYPDRFDNSNLAVPRRHSGVVMRQLTLLFALIAVLLGSCHQMGVLLRDPKPYEGVLKEPTLTKAKITVHNYGCRHESSCFVMTHIRPKVINPTSWTIFPKISCVYTINDWAYGTRKIKEFAVPSYSSRTVWIDNYVLVQNFWVNRIVVDCELDYELNKRKVAKHISYDGMIDMTKNDPYVRVHPAEKRACVNCR